MLFARLFFTTLAIMLLSISFASAQSNNDANKGNPPNWPMEVVNLKVSLADLMKLHPSGNMITTTSSMGTMGTRNSIGGKGGEEKLLFTLKSKNTLADKTIVAIEWESRFFNTQHQLVVKQFKSKKKIKPNKDETIEEAIFYDPNLVPANARIGFRINKIEYEDKTYWSNSLQDSESSLVYQNVTIEK